MDLNVSGTFFDLINFAAAFLSFVRDKLVPFLTVPPESITVYSPFIILLNLLEDASIRIPDWLFEIFGVAGIWEIPWPFGDMSIAMLFFSGGLVFILGFRLVKFFTDIVL